jgi:hypothetical protein
MPVKDSQPARDIKRERGERFSLFRWYFTKREWERERERERERGGRQKT